MFQPNLQFSPIGDYKNEKKNRNGLANSETKKYFTHKRMKGVPDPLRSYYSFGCR